MIDAFGATHSTSSQDAVSAFSDAVRAVASHRPIGTALQRALKHDEAMLAAHALHGLGNVILGRAETVATAKTILRTIDVLLALPRGATPSELALIDALRLAAVGQLQDAASRLETHLEYFPCDFLAAKLSHALRFMSGQPERMLAVTRRILPSWSPSDGGYGYILGCHAFGLEEAGSYLAAETYGREAYRYERTDAWGLHAVSHVMEMTKRSNEGADWLEAARPDWKDCNNFSFHLGWHLALFHLEQGRVDAVLDIYDRDISPTATDDFRDMANATSLLWRLELEGVPVGGRWAPLYEIASKRRADMTYVFASLHYLLALVASRDWNGATELMENLQHLAQCKYNEQASISAEVGVPLAKTIMAMFQKSHIPINITHAASKICKIGGSHAQRDVFLRTLLLAAAEDGDAASLLAIAKIRRRLRGIDRFMSVVERSWRARHGSRHSLVFASLSQ